MLCQRCGKNAATTIFTQTINGHTATEHICSECAVQSGISSFFHNFPLGSMMSGLISPNTLSYKRCEKCGSSFGEMMESGKIGCSDCYRVFREELIPTIQNIHGKAVHVGKSPRGIPKQLPQEIQSKSALDELKEKLQEAIQSQDFESAVKYRDEIKEIEQQ